MNSCNLDRLQATLVAIITITILYPFLTTTILLYPLRYRNSMSHIFYTPTVLFLYIF